MLSPISRELTDAILFDMDGVLLDTEPLYEKAWNGYLSRFQQKLTPSLIERMKGRPALVSAALVIESFRLPLTPEEVIKERSALLESLVRDSPAFPGAEQLVLEFKARGFKLALATSTANALYRIKTARHEWFQAFDCVVCGDDPEVSSPKPSPDIFLVAARRLAVVPERCVVFEDSPAGLQAAWETRARVIQVGTPKLPLGSRTGEAVSSLEEALASLKPAK